MSYLTLKHTGHHESTHDNYLLDLFKNLLKTNPKPKKLSQSMYLTCLAIEILEQLGNHHPSQHEIDAIEAILKRYSNRKLLKDVFKSACINPFDL